MSVTLDDGDEPVPGLGPDGRPDPAYAAALGLLPAPAGRRAVAFLLDAVIAVALATPAVIGALLMLAVLAPVGFDINAVLGQGKLRAPFIVYIAGQAAVTLFLFVQLLMHGLKGVTVGKAAAGIRSVNVAHFGKPGFWRIVLRDLVLAAAFTIVPYIGAVPFLLSPLWDPEKRGRGWQDRIGANWLVDVRKGLDPFNAKLMRHARRAVESPSRAEEAKMPSLATGTEWAGPTFVPSDRSSSGVISAPQHEEVVDSWEAPPVAAPWEPPPVGAPVAAAPAVVVPAAAPAPAAPRTEPEPVVTPAVVKRAEVIIPVADVALVFDDGERLDIEGPGLLGRNPEAQPGEHPVHLFRVEDKARLISKTHAEFGFDDRGFWLADRGSVNGTLLTIPSGEQFTLEAGAKTHLALGSTVAIGGRSFTVSAKRS